MTDKNRAWAAAKLCQWWGCSLLSLLELVTAGTSGIGWIITPTDRKISRVMLPGSHLHREIACLGVAPCWGEVKERHWPNPFHKFVSRSSSVGLCWLSCRKAAACKLRPAWRGVCGLLYTCWASCPSCWWEIWPKTIISQTLCSRS